VSWCVPWHAHVVSIAFLLVQHNNSRHNLENCYAAYGLCAGAHKTDFLPLFECRPFAKRNLSMTTALRSSLLRAIIVSWCFSLRVLRARRSNSSFRPPRETSASTACWVELQWCH
jgi:hypothetical protein